MLSRGAVCLFGGRAPRTPRSTGWVVVESLMLRAEQDEDGGEGRGAQGS